MILYTKGVKLCQSHHDVMRNILSQKSRFLFLCVEVGFSQIQSHFDNKTLSQSLYECQQLSFDYSQGGHHCNQVAVKQAVELNRQLPVQNSEGFMVATRVATIQ